MPEPFPKVPLWKIYTPRNVRNEIVLRWSAFQQRRARRSHPGAYAAAPYDAGHAAEVGTFYSAHHEDFLKVYGDVIQAFRTKNIQDLLDHQIRAIGFQPGQRVLDAGCGVAAPAIHFAKHAGVQVDAITISAKQYEQARRNVAASGFGPCIRVVHGDYHLLKDYFPARAYDVVYFLESFGHSRAKHHLIRACQEMLKPGGTLFIKDLFRRIPLRPSHAERIDREIRKIDEAYRYEIADLNQVLDMLRGTGFILDSVRSIDLDVAQFEDLAISNEFQELTGLALIGDFGQYVFPVDFFEIKCVKPEFSIDERLDRHFLQTRYHRLSDEPGPKGQSA